MKAIILAAGRGTRLKPITDTTPKPLIQIRGKSILENLLEQLVNHVSEFIIIVDYKKEVFIETLGYIYCGVPIIYKNQGEKKGTGAAIEGIETTEDVLVIYADSIFSSGDIQTLISHGGAGCLVQEVDTPEKYGIFSQDSQGNALKVIEKPSEYVGNLANLGAYKFSPLVLQLVKKLEPSPRGEYELTDAINELCKVESFRLFPIKGYFLDVSYPEDIKKTEGSLQKQSISLLKNKPAFGTSVLLDNLKNCQIYLGIDERHISELIEYSQDTSDSALQNNTGDAKRFAKKEDIEKWYNASDRHLFSLVGPDNELAGIWWARPCKAPEITEIQDQTSYEILESNINNLHTNAIRIYPQFRGQRIATPFVKKCSMYYRDIFPDGVMCIDTDSENIPLQKSYEKGGYQKVGIGEGEKSVESTEKRVIYIQVNN